LSQDKWHDDLAKLQAEVSRLNSHRFIRMHNSTTRLLWFNFMRGLAFGLGSVIGATVLVSLLAYFLRGVDFIRKIRRSG
jgi:allophanate hydrolase subunit 1